MQRLATLASVMALASTTALPSLALTIDPTLSDPQLFIQQTPNGGAALGGDPNLITNTGAFYVGESGNNTNHSVLNPLLIGVAVYNNQDPGVKISYATCPQNGTTCPSAFTGSPLDLYGVTISGPVQLTAGQDVFTRIGATQADNSLKFSNFNTAEAGIGLAAASEYTIYLFELPTGLDPSLDPIQIDTTAEKGDFIFALDCEAVDPSSPTGACQNGSVGFTTMTNVGLADAPPPPPVPEPNTIFLFGTGLLGLVGMVRAAKSKGGMRLYRDA